MLQSGWVRRKNRNESFMTYDNCGPFQSSSENKEILRIPPCKSLSQRKSTLQDAQKIIKTSSDAFCSQLSMPKDTSLESWVNRVDPLWQCDCDLDVAPGKTLREHRSDEHASRWLAASQWKGGTRCCGHLWTGIERMQAPSRKRIPMDI